MGPNSLAEDETNRMFLYMLAISLRTAGAGPSNSLYPTGNDTKPFPWLAAFQQELPVKGSPWLPFRLIEVITI